MPMDGFADDIARVRAQQAIDRLIWFQQRPVDMSLYCQAYGIMQRHGSLFWNGFEHTDVSWESHDVRHAFGIADDARWLESTSELQRRGLAELCSLTGYVPDDLDREAISDWFELDISMRGVLHLATLLGDPLPPAQRAAWWCSESVCLCGQRTTRPLAGFCAECDPFGAPQGDNP